MPHRWHVRGGAVGWGYRYLLDPAVEILKVPPTLLDRQQL